MRKFRFGWYGDNGLGEDLIQRILLGVKTACTAPAYDPVDADLKAGEEVLLTDKAGNARGLLRITAVEVRPFGSLDEEVARREGLTLAELKDKLNYANSREFAPDEEMRVTTFELVSQRAPPAARP